MFESFEEWIWIHITHHISRIGEMLSMSAFLSGTHCHFSTMLWNWFMFTPSWPFSCPLSHFSSPVGLSLTTTVNVSAKKGSFSLLWMFGIVRFCVCPFYLWSGHLKCTGANLQHEHRNGFVAQKEIQWFIYLLIFI